MYQMLKAVAFAHARRVIHRDLKPQNILVDRARNALKVADFGLARCFTPPIRPYTHEARGVHSTASRAGGLSLYLAVHAAVVVPGSLLLPSPAHCR